MQGRRKDLDELLRRLRRQPVVGILGPRQVGKSTLARALADEAGGATAFFDLESAADLRRLADETTALEPLRGLIVLDEIQRRPDLFPALRVLADRPRRPATFLVLGSASPQLLRQSSESLAGRITYYELDGFGLHDVGAKSWRKLWLRGGFPRSFLARTERESFEWLEDLRRGYVSQDLPALGPGFPSQAVARVWEMIVHFHGQTWNASEIARSFAVSHVTVRRYLDFLADTFMVRLLRPWSQNVGKRVVKAPKVYFRDTGLLHLHMGVRSADELAAHPRLGASFEGFALAETVRRLGVDWSDCWFWATHQGAEVDLVVVRGAKRYGFEFKHTVAPTTTKSMRIALEDLGLERLDVVHIGRETFPLTKQIRAVAFERLLEDIAPLR